MRSLRRQLTLGTLVSFALLLSAGGFLVHWALRDSLYDQFDDALRVRALIVSTETRVSGGRIRVYFSDRFLREFDDALATEFFQVFAGDGRPIERSDSLPAEVDLPSRHGTLAEPAYWNLELPNGEPGRAVGIRFTPASAHRRANPPEPELEAIVVVAASRREIMETVARLRHVLLGSGGALLVLTALVVPWVLRRALRPLDHVAAAVTRIDAHSLEQRFQVQEWPRELEPVGLRLNDLLARLQRSFERERTFSSDLAHELRTPLAELRSSAEVALKWPEERTAAMDEAVLAAALQMERLVTRLLELGRAEQGRLAIGVEEVDVDHVLRELMAKSEDVAKTRRVRLEQRGEPVGRVPTDPVLLRSILGNLLNNAVTYAPPESTAVIETFRGATTAELNVRNAAPGLDASDLPKLFERFWRKDNARSGDAHSGLGLALSRSFAQLLGGSLEARLDRGELVMKFQLPIGRAS